MQLGLLLLILAAPLLELALLIKLGQAFGFWPVMALVIGTAVIGALIIRRQGFSMLRRMMDDAGSDRPGIANVIEGGLLVVAGLLLVLPGPMTDTLGLLLLIPPVRWLLAARIGRNAIIVQRVDVRGFGARRGPPGSTAGERPADDPARHGHGAVIEGEFVRVDEPEKRNGKGQT